MSIQHEWKLSAKQAIELQKQLAKKVVISSVKKNIRFIAGLDAAFSSDGKKCIAAVVLWDYKNKIIVEQHNAIDVVNFPYIPGLLSFREIPALLLALKKLSLQPDMIMCDGQGIAHPRRFGIACHVGVLTNIPTIGCAKSRLCGKWIEPETEPGAKSILSDKDEIIGTVLRTKKNVKPLFISVGHKANLNFAEKIVLDCCLRHRLPEPTRLADKFAAESKKDLLK